MSESQLNSAASNALKQQKQILLKPNSFLADIESAIPTGIAFGDNLNYESNCRNFHSLVTALPKIDGWKQRSP